MNQNTVAAGEAEFDPARERTTLVNALAEAARAALEFDFMSAAVLGAIPGTEPQQYVIAGVPAGISKMLPAISGELPAVITNKDIRLGELIAYTHGLRDARNAAAELALASPSPVSEAQAERVSGWTSVNDRLPAVGELVLVYSPSIKYDHHTDGNIGLDCIDLNDDDHASWLSHNEHYEHFCCVAKPEGSTGPSSDAPYTHWMPLPPAPLRAVSTGEQA